MKKIIEIKLEILILNLFKLEVNIDLHSIIQSL